MASTDLRPLPAAEPERRGAVPRHPEAGAARRDPRDARARRSSRSSSCASGRCRCSPARSTCAPPRTTSCAPCASQAPRGPILDRYGRVLVTNIPGTEIQIWPADLPKTGPLPAPAQALADRAVPGRAGRRRDRPAQRRPAHAGDRQAGRDRGPGRLPLRAPGRVPRRRRSRRPTCASTRTARSRRRCSATSARSRPAQLKTDAKHGYRPGDTIGQAGVEASYDRSCAASPGRPSSASTRSAARAATSRSRSRRAPGNVAPADARREAAGGRRARDPLRDRASRAQWAARRRRDRRDGPARRLDPRARLVPDLQPERLRRPGRPRRRSTPPA